MVAARRHAEVTRIGQKQRENSGSRQWQLGELSERSQRLQLQFGEKSAMAPSKPLLHTRTLLAATTTVGRRSMTSRAKDGPDKKTAGCLRCSAEGMISDIICPVATSSPLLTLMIATSDGSTPCEEGCVSSGGRVKQLYSHLILLLLLSICMCTELEARGIVNCLP